VRSPWSPHPCYNSRRIGLGQRAEVARQKDFLGRIEVILMAEKKSDQIVLWIALLSALLGSLARLLEAVAEIFRAWP